MCCRSIGYYPFKKNDNFFFLLEHTMEENRQLICSIHRPMKERKKNIHAYIYYNGAKDGSLHEDNNEILSPPTLHCIFTISSSNE